MCSTWWEAAFQFPTSAKLIMPPTENASPAIVATHSPTEAASTVAIPLLREVAKTGTGRLRSATSVPLTGSFLTEPASQCLISAELTTQKGGALAATGATI